MRSQPNYFEVVLFRCCFVVVVVVVDVVFVLDVYIVVWVTLYVDLRVLLIEVEFVWW